MKTNKLEDKDLILNLINSLDSNQFDLFLQLYNKLYDSRKSKQNDGLLDAKISQVCYNRLKTDTNIKTKFKNIGGIPLILNKWWYNRYGKCE